MSLAASACRRGRATVLTTVAQRADDGTEIAIRH